MSNFLEKLKNKKYSEFEKDITNELNQKTSKILSQYKEEVSESFLFEEMSPEEIQKSEEKSKDLFNKEIKKIFPDFVGMANKSPLGGGITFSFANITKEQSKDNTAFSNAPFKFKGIMHLTDGGGRRVPMSKFSIESLMVGRGFKENNIKFRKITGKSPEDAVKKLLKWFEKNKKAIEEVTE